MDVPEDRKFLGFDGYKKAMDCLKPGDVAIFATPPAFRWVHFTYAIEKGLNVFMEKPVTVDGPTTRRMIELAERGRQEEPQGGRGPDGPPLPRPAGTAQADPATARSATSSPCAATAWAADRRHVGPKPGEHERAAVPDPAVPQLHLGQRRRVQRLLHPPDRRVLLDEGRLAGPGPGARADATTAATPVDQNLDTYSVEYTYPGRHQAVLRRPAT